MSDLTMADNYIPTYHAASEENVITSLDFVLLMSFPFSSHLVLFHGRLICLLILYSKRTQLT